MPTDLLFQSALGAQLRLGTAQIRHRRRLPRTQWSDEGQGWEKRLPGRVMKVSETRS